MKLNKKQKNIYKWLLENKGYLKKSAEVIFNTVNFPFNCSYIDIKRALEKARIDYRSILTAAVPSTKNVKKPLKTPNFKEKRVSIITSTVLDPNNVLFLPDLHAPFIKEGFLEFSKEEQLKYKCGTVVAAGDIVDGHAWSYHEHDPDGYSVGDEIAAAKEQLQPWYEAYPVVFSCMGNHDLLIQRKARTIGLSKHFIKGFGEVIDAPKGWTFGLEYIKDNVLYKHGNVGDAFKVAKESRISTCQGHFHAKTFVQWSVSEKDSIFGMQVGWGADRHKYAFDYGKAFSNKPILSLGVVLDRGRTPIVKLMDL